MNYSAYYSTDMVNGPGIRAVLFVSGCTHACPGCYNESTWSPLAGARYTPEIEDQIIRDLKDTRIVRSGLTLTGGDPLHQHNRYDVLRLILRVRKECPDKTIWLWTGYYDKEIMEDKDARMRYIRNNVDVVVDGRFIKELHDPNLRFRGSSNQTIINVRNI
ncbi:UNVERIFIED_CONTAM: anaerobic ribonucleoside-triphosphate reductase-activating protein [Kocuria sp. CPCC 205274]|uniref:Anaerobic ribonucleoside-triphosphate reductase-activating protein n=1 Tax=Herbiconiux daphne TaxID=2970914 RepID=A0ABT2HA10_9MICO|nr:anaerobic ribonucleoside-triphosphate reductase-activating protein [Herbiconiux daphne]MCS5736707.1 anaerobic ribonucleoside-triphosphate reductase-activating protein [Herbiconiux daphne]